LTKLGNIKKKIERQFWKWTWNSESVEHLSQSKCFTYLKPQQKHSTVDNFEQRYDFLNMKKNWHWNLLVKLTADWKKNLKKFWKMCEQRSSLDRHVHYDWPFAILIRFGIPFRKVFGSARLEYYGICNVNL